MLLQHIATTMGTMGSSSRSSRNVVIIGAAAAAGVLCCWGLMKQLASRSGQPRESMAARRQKLAEAVQRFGSMFPKVNMQRDPEQVLLSALS
jgi:hypothetical protein